jgi:hypothetical protein
MVLLGAPNLDSERERERERERDRESLSSPPRLLLKKILW